MDCFFKIYRKRKLENFSSLNFDSSWKPWKRAPKSTKSQISVSFPLQALVMVYQGTSKNSNGIRGRTLFVGQQYHKILTKSQQIYGSLVRSQKEVCCMSHFLCSSEICSQAVFWLSQSETTNLNTRPPLIVMGLKQTSANSVEHYTSVEIQMLLLRDSNTNCFPVMH